MPATAAPSLFVRMRTIQLKSGDSSAVHYRRQDGRSSAGSIARNTPRRSPRARANPAALASVERVRQHAYR